MTLANLIRKPLVAALLGASMIGVPVGAVYITGATRALEEYQKGGRKNPIMTGLAASLKPADIAEIAVYFSALTPGLKTEPRPYTRFSSQ